MALDRKAKVRPVRVGRARAYPSRISKRERAARARREELDVADLAHIVPEVRPVRVRRAPGEDEPSPPVACAEEGGMRAPICSTLCSLSLLPLAKLVVEGTAVDAEQARSLGLIATHQFERA